MKCPVFRMLAKRTSMSCVSTLCLAWMVAAQPQAPPSPPPRPAHRPKDISQRIREIRIRLEAARPTSTEERELKSFAQRYLEEAEAALAKHQTFFAASLADAADACRRPLDHLAEIDQQHRPAPPPQAIITHLRRVYFRLRLCNYFLQQIPQPRPDRLLAIARHFYQLAQESLQAGKLANTELYTVSADDLTHALESLAQAYAPPPSPPPPPRAPR
jgi:hypothetical protein